MPLFLHEKVATWKIVIGEMYIWEVAAWEIAHLGSCPWEKSFSKVPTTLFSCLHNIKWTIFEQYRYCLNNIDIV